MKKLTAMFCSAVMTVGSLAVPVAPAFAMPMTSAGFDAQISNLQEIRYRRGFHRPYYYYPRYYRHGLRGHYRGYRHGAWVPGAFIAGAIIGGAIANAPYRYHRPYRGYDYYYQGRCSGWRGDCW